MMSQNDGTQNLTSPGGFIIGNQGWIWSEPKAKTITFFLDNTAGVYDQYGRPIRGTITLDNKKVLFAMNPPSGDDFDSRKDLATHLQVIEALENEKIDWKTLSWAGWPQIPYEKLVPLIKSNKLPPTPIEELNKIKDPKIKKDAFKAKKELEQLNTVEQV